MAHFEALHGSVLDLDEALILDPDLIQDNTGTIKKIQEHIQTL